MLPWFHLQLLQKLKGRRFGSHLDQLQLAKSHDIFQSEMFHQLGLYVCSNWSHQCMTWKSKIHVPWCNTKCLKHRLQQKVGWHIGQLCPRHFLVQPATILEDDYMIHHSHQISWQAPFVLQFTLFCTWQNIHNDF